MATAQASLVDEIAAEFRPLHRNPHIDSILSQWVDDAYVVWIGILGDDDGARHAAYELEDYVSVKFPRVLFDFHVIALPEGRTTQDYVSEAEVVFQRRSA